ncbi:MAG: hypothetical protein O3A51_11860, partial [Verrucomicrobia bacterium]|nr:hypothetical protein [Verrucomicrobiota bacterium]
MNRLMFLPVIVACLCGLASPRALEAQVLWSMATSTWVAAEVPVYCDPDDDWAKDPSVINVGDTWYMYYTSANPWQGDGSGGKG